MIETPVYNEFLAETPEEHGVHNLTADLGESFVPWDDLLGPERMKMPEETPEAPEPDTVDAPEQA